MKGYNVNTIILDQNDKIIFSSQDQQYLTSENLVQNLSTEESLGSKTIGIQNRDYLFSFVKSTETHWKYISLIPVENVFEQVNQIKLIFIYGFALILFLGSAFISWMMFLNYRPIAELKQYSEKYHKENKSLSNELDIVRSTLDFLDSKNVELQDEIENNSFAVKQYFLFQLLRGQISSLTELNQKGEKIGLKFTQPDFRVVIFHINGIKSGSSAQSFTNIIENFLPPEIAGYARDHSEQDRIVLVTNYNFLDDAALMNSLSELLDKLKNEFKTAVTLGVGDKYTDITLIPKSYMEAMAAIDYRFVKGMNKIIYFNEVVSTQSTFDASLSRAAEKLKLFISQGNIEQIENLLTNILNYFKQNNTSIFLVRMFCFDIINTVIHTADEMNNEYLIHKKDYPDVFLLSSFETVDELTDVVRKISQDICTAMQESKENKTLLLIDQMTAYIKNNYSNCNFSIQQMADHFKMSFSYLSQYFKEQTGLRILDYETNLKIEKAKHLLATTSLPLKDIAMETGYCNPTSFIRRFKQLVGVTPTEYRKQIS